jgi:hypothetical protein
MEMICTKGNTQAVASDVIDSNLAAVACQDAPTPCSVEHVSLKDNMATPLSAEHIKNLPTPFSADHNLMKDRDYLQKESGELLQDPCEGRPSITLESGVVQLNLYGTSADPAHGSQRASRTTSDCGSSLGSTLCSDSGTESTRSHS